MESIEKFKMRLLTKEETSKLKKKVTNINMGIMGHIDSGKTSISSSLTSIASTASLDKNPQSKEKGITIDLGFSSFVLQAAQEFQINHIPFGKYFFYLI
jgi:selenocysteine-specific elongation factor